MKLRLIPILLITISTMSCKTQKIGTITTPNSESDMAVLSGVTNTEWILTELKGAKVDQNPIQGRKVGFTLNSKDNTFNGFFGCNTGFGKFSIEDGNRIRFSEIGVTRMACYDQQINESQVMEVFHIADSYTLDGNHLVLNLGKGAPLAVFEAVYLD